MNLSNLKNADAKEVAKLLNSSGREAFVQRFTTLGLPHKKTEEYHYFDVDKILNQEYNTLEYIPQTIEEGDKVKIVDGIVVTIPQGLRINYETCKQLDIMHFDPLYFVGHLLSHRIIKIEIDGDTDVEIEHHFTKSDTLIHYRIVLSNQANRHATVHESFVSEDISNTLVLYGYDIHVAQDSTLRLVKLQTMKDAQYSMVASHKINVAKNAHMMLKSFDFGGDQALQLLKVELAEHAHIDAGHLLYLNEDSKRGTVSQIIHQGEYSTSKQEAKNILDGQARGIFDALIRVEHSAKFTKAEQNAKSILLHEKAYMVSKPQLEIYIDELEASHGATTGQLDEKQLFYLQSRGISHLEARKILVIAFANTLIEQVKDTRAQERIKTAFEEVFYASNTNEG
ncbi:MAG TPA: Fe-S cluster assembly protein SufD [Sulfurovum sp.]|nr:Fe-S cluster assembly protein SufD [Sulfurovum sp.]